MVIFQRKQTFILSAGILTCAVPLTVYAPSSRYASYRADVMSAYLFCGKRCDRIKILIKEPDGICLLYKRLDRSIQGRFRWPRSRDEVKPITWRQFDWLMSGIEIEQPKALKTAV